MKQNKLDSLSKILLATGQINTLSSNLNNEISSLRNKLRFSNGDERKAYNVRFDELNRRYSETLEMLTRMVKALHKFNDDMGLLKNIDVYMYKAPLDILVNSMDEMIEMIDLKEDKKEIVISKFGINFENWLSSYIKDGLKHFFNNNSKWKLGSELYESFLEKYSIPKKELSREMFKKNLKEGLFINGYCLLSRKIRVNGSIRHHYSFKIY